MRLRWNWFLFLLIGLIAIAVNLIPDLVSDDLKAWCLEYLGPNYIWYLLVILVAGNFMLLIFTGDFKVLLQGRQNTQNIAVQRIPWTKEADTLLSATRKYLTAARQREALEALAGIKHPSVEEQVSLLSARLSQYEQDSRASILTYEQGSVEFNKLNKAILSLVDDIERQLPEGQKENRQLRDSLGVYYADRLVQKLANMKPVNLRRLISAEGTSARVAATFIPYPANEVAEEIGKVFHEAQGRLLLVGQPGAGKTTLLLQLAQRLLELEANAVPLVINLATWRSDYVTLEAWLETVLVDELSTNKAGTRLILRQAELILLLDGLDELREEEAMNSCLAAIANFGRDPARRFVITCRIEEYKQVKEDARVNLQIEIGPLNPEQLQAELRRLASMTPRQPEAALLLNDLQTDPFLREALQTPFYLNTAQLLYAGRLPKFYASDTVGRKAEIVEQFVDFALQNLSSKSYSPEKARHWLSFLASRMNERHKVVFELRDLQYDWWGRWRKGEFILARLVLCLVFWIPLGLVIGFALGLVIGLMIGFVLGLVVGQVLVLALGLVVMLWIKISPEINTIDRIVWSWKNFKRYNLINAFDLIKYVFVLIFVGPFLGLIGLQSPGVILVLMVAFILLISPVIGLLRLVANDSTDFTRIHKPYQRFTASMKVLHFSIFQHFHLRWLLYKKGALPWDLVNFLNEMARRNLFESDGATWRFRHQIIQDYFSEQWVGPAADRSEPSRPIP